MHKKTNKHKVKKFRTVKFIKVTLIYFVLFLALLGMVDYYAMMMYNFIAIFVLSLGAALIAGYVHVKRGKHDHVDDIAEEFL